jgi:formylglycine-generating enzyme required for sulfatase activity
MAEVYYGVLAEFEASSLDYYTKYYWRVVAIDGVGNESEGPVWHFYHPAESYVYVPPGTFMMGSPVDEQGRSIHETQHQVTLTRGFFMSRYEVTEEWWSEVSGGSPTSSQLPKHYVSWDMAVQFCKELSDLEGLTPAYTINGLDGDVAWNPSAEGYRLPTEAEWEYACRAGSTTAFANGPITCIYCEPLDLNLDVIGWYCGNRTHLEGPAFVGQKHANAWGLYDMHGNVWEWVWDGYRLDYQNLFSVDPVYNVGPGLARVIRGGLWGDWAQACRSAYRECYAPEDVLNPYGFRPVRSAF